MKSEKNANRVRNEFKNIKNLNRINELEMNWKEFEKSYKSFENVIEMDSKRVRVEFERSLNRIQNELKQN